MLWSWHLAENIPKKALSTNPAPRGARGQARLALTSAFHDVIDSTVIDSCLAGFDIQERLIAHTHGDHLLHTDFWRGRNPQPHREVAPTRPMGTMQPQVRALLGWAAPELLRLDLFSPCSPVLRSLHRQAIMPCSGQAAQCHATYESPAKREAWSGEEGRNQTAATPVVA